MIIRRILQAEDLEKDNLWWHGPKWLITPESHWPHNEEITISDQLKHDIDSEIKAVRVLYEAKLVAGEGLRKQHEQTGHSPFNMDSKAYSSVTKLMRVTALAMKFIEILKRKSINK